MVCKHCGSQLSISDKKCPFCGMENTAAAAHHEAMSGYEEKFDNTRTEVLQEVKKSRKTIVMLALIALLAALNVFLMITRANAYSLEESLREKDLRKNKATIEAQLAAYIEIGNYSGLYGYCSEKGILYSQALEEYTVVAMAASTYDTVLEQLSELQDDMSGYQTDGENVSYLAGAMEQLYQLVSREYYSYKEEIYYNELAVQVLADVQEQCEVLLQAYFGLSNEEIAGLPDMERQQIEFLLGRSWGLYE